MEIEVKGHSGCQIDIVRENNELFVSKSTRDPKYLDRLQLQAQKQQDAAKVELQHIRIPRIVNVHRDERSVVVKMEYVYSKNFIGYFEYAGFEQIAYFTKALKLFLDYEINNSSLQTVKADILKLKFADVAEKIKANEVLKDDAEIYDILNASEKIFANATDMELPVGKCHGDLTFSNILFNGNNYYLIDFLDSFIESPLLDIVKIRQDSAFQWSQLMFTGEYDRLRLKIVADKIDSDIVKYASQYEWYQYYNIFQLMNFLRVLQYAHEQEVINYLKRIIKQLLHEF